MTVLRRLVVWLALGPLAWPPVAAQQSTAGGFRGVVLSSSDSAPLARVDVWLISLDRHALTDSTGRFSFNEVAPGQHLVELRRIGFAVRRDTVVVDAGRESIRDYTLARRAEQLDTVHTVAGQRKYVSPALQGFEARRLSKRGGHFITDSVLRRYESSTLTNIIAARMPGLMQQRGHLVSSRRGCRGLAFEPKPTCLRGQNDCYVAIALDGVVLYSPDMAGQPPDLAKLSVTQFAGVEFYPGEASTPSGMHISDGGCGSLWLWTREK